MDKTSDVFPFLGKFIGFNSYKGFRQKKLYRFRYLYDDGTFGSAPFIEAVSDLGIRAIPLAEFKIISNTEQFMMED